MRCEQLNDTLGDSKQLYRKGLKGRDCLKVLKARKESRMGALYNVTARRIKEVSNFLFRHTLCRCTEKSLSICELNVQKMDLVENVLWQ